MSASSSSKWVVQAPWLTERVVHTSLLLQLALLLKEQLRCLEYQQQLSICTHFWFSECIVLISICATELFLQWQSLTDRWIEDVKINISHLHLKHPTTWFKKNKIDMLWGRHFCLVGPVLLVCFWRTVIAPRKNTSTWEEYQRKDVLLEIACSLGFLEIATKC